MTRTGPEAIAWGRAQDRNESQDWHNLCLSFVRQAFGLDYVGDWPNASRYAGMAWRRAQVRHYVERGSEIPAGVPVFWNSTSQFEHIALSLGGGRCLSTDVPRGRVGEISIDELTRAWGMELLGWTEDLVGNDLRVHQPPKPLRALDVHGVDISHHQPGQIGYAAAKTAGVKWMYHKATEGATYRDKNYGRRRSEAAKAGLPFGAYHFARHEGADALEEARAFLAYADPQPGDLGPCLDIETTEGMSNGQIDEWAVRWGTEVKRETGGPLVLYTPFDLPKAQKLFDVIWRPRYNSDNRPPELPHQIHQFSNGDLGVPNRIAGFGHVDLNVMKNDLTTKDMLIPEPVQSRQEHELLLLQASQSWPDSDDDTEADIADALQRGAHVVGFTEVSKRNGNLDILRKVAADAGGWHVVWGPAEHSGAEAALAVHPSLKVVDEGYVYVNAPDSKKGDGIGHSARYVAWVTFEFHGRDVTVVEGHWVTAPEGIQDRPDKREEMSRVVAEIAEAKGKGSKLVFVMGDTNEDDHRNNDGSEVYDPMGNLDSIFDELGTWPSTHGRLDKGATIDIILSYTRDKSVTAKAVRIYQAKSDHHHVLGVYGILAPRKQAAA